MFKLKIRPNPHTLVNIHIKKETNTNKSRNKRQVITCIYQNAYCLYIRNTIMNILTYTIQITIYVKSIISTRSVSIRSNTESKDMCKLIDLYMFYK